MDCPHRERGGYGADGQTALPAYLYLFDSAVWFYSGLAGIRPDEKMPGFENFYLVPAFPRELDFVTASYSSPRGHIESRIRLCSTENLLPYP